MTTEKESPEEIIKEYGWPPKKLKEQIVRSARQLLIYDDNGKPTLDDDFRRGFEEPAEIWAYFLDAEQRLPEGILEYFFDVVEERAGEEEEYSFEQRVDDLLDFHAGRMSDALQEYVGPILQTTYPGFNWYVGVVDSLYVLTPDGLSLAKARCDYLSSRYPTAIDVSGLRQKIKN